MKISVIVLMCVCFLAASVSVLAGERVNIKSSAPFIVAHGQYVYPVDSVYTVTLTDTSVLVQGKVYEPPEKPFVPLPKPDRKKDFLDWVIRTPADSAGALLDAGDTPEQAKILMDNFFRQFPKSDTFSVRFSGGSYLVTYRGKEWIVPLPCMKREPKPDHKQNTLVPAFEGLCFYLRVGALVFKGDGGMQPIPAEELSPSLIRQLKGVTEQTAVKRPVGFRGKTRYRGITIKGQIREIYLGSDDITNLVNANRKESSHED
jgi:hypothetical protein